MSDSSAPRITFLGAARTVTGSMHLLQVGDKRLLIDCGMFQGRREESREKNSHLPKEALRADAVVLTHAHIDHSGILPRLVKDGFKGRIYTTDATADLCHAMLLDSARIQVHDAMWLNKKSHRRGGAPPVEPLYDEEDAEKTLEQFEPQPYHKRFSPLPGITVEFSDAGHILGSASALVEIAGNGSRQRRVLFSGDIGRRNLPILRDPEIPDGADYVVMESTYGDRVHGPVTEMHDQLCAVIEKTRKRGGKILIPSFALERTQEIVYALNQLIQDGRMKPMPVYLDSPLAINLTEVFRRHPECYDEETEDFDDQNGDPFGFAMLQSTPSVEESKALNRVDEPCIIISASGMCEFGRIVHHLRNNIEDPNNTVVIVGYQAPHTLGRRLVERRSEVKIFGMSRPLRCEVKVLNAFSAHADKDELMWWAGECGPQVERFFCVHGDEDQCEALSKHLADAGRKTTVPSPRQTVVLDD